MRCSIVVSLVIDVDNSPVFSAVLDHVPGSEHTIPLYHVPDHDSVPPQTTLND